MVTHRFSSDFDTLTYRHFNGGYTRLHGNLWTNLEIMKAKIKDKHQNILMISGRTGTGKSELAIQIGAYLDPNFTIDNIFWNTDEMIRVAASKDDIKPPGTCFMFDEAREGTQSLNAMSETNRKMGLFLDTIRSRGYHILLLQPSPFLFQKSIFIYAADLLIHVEKKGNTDFLEELRQGKIGDEIVSKPFERGYGRIYDNDQKHKLYIQGKKMENLNAASSTFFTFEKSHKLIDWEEYERRKSLEVAKMNEAFEKEAEPKINPRLQKVIDFKKKAYYHLEKKGMTAAEIAAIFEDHTNKVYEYINQHKLALVELNSNTLN